jgi:hypothetical protein
MVQYSGMKLERVIPDVAMIRKVWACEIFSCEAPGLAAVPLTARNTCGSRHFKFVVGWTRIAKNAPELDLNPIRMAAGENENRPPPCLLRAKNEPFCNEPSICSGWMSKNLYFLGNVICLQPCPDHLVESDHVGEHHLPMPS